MIAHGHSSQDVWNYTPRRISAFLEFARGRLRIEYAQALAAATMGARGDPKEVKKQLKDLQR